MNGARVKISRNLLVEMLGYQDGILHHIREPESYINPKELHLYIEHPDLPFIEEGEAITDIQPMIEVKYYKNGRYSFKRL